MVWPFDENVLVPTMIVWRNKINQRKDNAKDGKTSFGKFLGKMIVTFKKINNSDNALERRKPTVMMLCSHSCHWIASPLPQQGRNILTPTNLPQYFTEVRPNEKGLPLKCLTVRMLNRWGKDAWEIKGEDKMLCIKAGRNKCLQFTEDWTRVSCMKAQHCNCLTRSSSNNKNTMRLKYNNVLASRLPFEKEKNGSTTALTSITNCEFAEQMSSI